MRTNMSRIIIKKFELVKFSFQISTFTFQTPSKNFQHLKELCLNQNFIVKKFFNSSPILNAGHSHWKNIKATKEIKDSQKQKAGMDIVRKIKFAILENGNQTNPKLNSSLAKVLEEGKSKDIPQSTLNAAIQRINQLNTKKGPQMFVEARTINGISFIVESFCEKQKWFKQNMQHFFRKFNGRVAEAGTCKHNFDYKGVVYASMETEKKQVNEEEAVDLAVEANAEEVVADLDETGQKILKFICEPKELHEVKKALQSQGLKPYEARLEFIPHTFIELDSEQLQLTSRLISELENIEDVNQVFHNATSK